jgi:hypothetical protein
MVAHVLESCDLNDAQRTTRYRTGTIVLFRWNDDGTGLRRETAYRVDAIDPDANTLRLLDPANQAITWDPAQGGADPAEAYGRGAPTSFATATASSAPATTMPPSASTSHRDCRRVRPRRGPARRPQQNGKRQTLDLANAVDRHIRPR